MLFCKRNKKIIKGIENLKRICYNYLSFKRRFIMKEEFVKYLTKDQIVKISRTIFGKKVIIDKYTEDIEDIVSYPPYSKNKMYNAFALYNKKHKRLEILDIELLTNKEETISGNLFLYDDHLVLEKASNLFNKYLVGEKEREYEPVILPDKIRLLYINQLYKLFGEDYKDFYIESSKKKLKKDLSELFENEKTSDNENTLQQ